MAYPDTARSARNARARKRKYRAHRLALLLAVLLLAAAVIYVVKSALDYAAVRILPPPNPVEYQIAHNRTPLRRSADDIQYIVIHDTANREAGADARSHYTFFNRADQQSSADFFVDDKEILQVNDYYSYFTWHCGDGSGPHRITNENSIGVEICINSDGNYQKAKANAVSLVRRLMEELHIDADHVVRHFDASGKACPGTMQDNNWRAWKAFKKELG